MYCVYYVYKHKPQNEIIGNRRGEPDGKRAMLPAEDTSQTDDLKFIDAGTNTCSSG